MSSSILSAKALYPVAEVERIISVSHSQLYRLINSGRLDACKIGSRSFVTAASITKFIEGLPRVGGGPKAA